MLGGQMSGRLASTPQEQICTTLWHCNQCNAVVSIITSQVVDEAFCPACGDASLEFCGTIAGIAWAQVGNA